MNNYLSANNNLQISQQNSAFVNQAAPWQAHTQISPLSIALSGGQTANTFQQFSIPSTFNPVVQTTPVIQTQTVSDVSKTSKNDIIVKNNSFIGRIYDFSADKINKILKKENADFTKREKNKKTATDTIIGAATTIGALGAYMGTSKIKTLVSSFTPSGSMGLKIASVAAPIATSLLLRPTLNFINNLPADKEVKKENKSSIINGLANGTSGIITGICPALAPVGLALNSTVSHFVSNKKSETDSKDFIDTHKATLALDILALGAIFISARKGKTSLDSVKDALMRAKSNVAAPILYHMPQDQLTEFQTLARDLGFDLGAVINSKGKLDISKIATLDEELMSILMKKGREGDIEWKMREIEKMNIFLPKYFQTVIDIPNDIQGTITGQIDAINAGYQARKNGKTSFEHFFTNHEIDKALDKLEEKGLNLDGLKDYQAIIQKIKSQCPASRTVDEAQEMINQAFGSGKYAIDRTAKNGGCLGVGSIAESYIAKDEKGNEVVIKLVKKHLQDGTKVDADKEALLKKLQEKSDISESGFNWHFGPTKYTIFSKEKQQYDTNQITNMCTIWKNETDLSQEAISAREIAAQASKYRAINPIDAKNGIFVMEKAKGVQLDSSKIVEEWQKAGLDEEDFSNLVDNYIGAYCEQLFALPKSGKKVVQSDPHGGNILIDLDALKALKEKGKGKRVSPVTIIDYGNTTKTDKREAVKNLFSHIDYLFGNTDLIASNMLEGADLGGKGKQEVIQELSTELREHLFNCDTKIDVSNPIEIFRAANSYCLDFMQRKNIIPNASNINQMKAEETYILSNLGCLKRIADGGNYDLSKAIDKKRIIKQLIGEMTNSVMTSLKEDPAFTLSQLKSRIAFIIKNPETAFSCLGANFEII